MKMENEVLVGRKIASQYSPREEVKPASPKQSKVLSLEITNSKFMKKKSPKKHASKLPS